jgi:hypothetical protein
MTKETYADYRRSDHWHGTRKDALWRAQNRCQSPICRYGYVRAWTEEEISEQLRQGEYRLDVHHLTYERLGSELADDLLVLCRNCHELIHGKRIINDEDDVLFAALYAKLRRKAV